MTKNEFLDVMGEIDGKLIESTLDISRMETVEIPYERPPVFRYIFGAAACVVAVFVTALAVRHFNGIATQPLDSTSENYSFSESESVSTTGSDSSDDSDISDSSSESTEAPEPDFIRGWDPEDYLSNGLHENIALGESLTLSTAELDGIKVALILHDITKLPGEEYSENGLDYTNYYGAKDIVLYIIDDKGRKCLQEYVTPHRNDGMQFIHQNCFIGESTRLFKTESDDGEHYVLMQIADYSEENDAPIATFYDVYMVSDRLDENGISGYGLIEYYIRGTGRVGGWRFGYQASGDFCHSGGTTFTDPVYNYNISICPNTDKAYVISADIPLQDKNADFSELNITGWDPDTLPFNTYPEVGESAVVSRAELDGLQAELIMINVIKRPGERHYIYSQDDYLDMWVADDICLYIKDDNGRRILSHLNTPLTTGFAKFMPEECLFVGSTKIFSVERDGVSDYVIMQYCTIDEDSGTLNAAFVSGDTELYDLTAPKDENGITIGGGLLPLTPRGTITSSSDGSLVILEDGSLYDREKNNTIIFCE